MRSLFAIAFISLSILLTAAGPQVGSRSQDTNFTLSKKSSKDLSRLIASPVSDRSSTRTLRVRILKTSNVRWLPHEGTEHCLESQKSCGSIILDAEVLPSTSNAVSSTLPNLLLSSFADEKTGRRSAGNFQQALVENERYFRDGDKPYITYKNKDFDIVVFPRPDWVAANTATIASIYVTPDLCEIKKEPLAVRKDGDKATELVTGDANVCFSFTTSHEFENDIVLSISPSEGPND